MATSSTFAQFTPLPQRAGLPFLNRASGKVPARVIRRFCNMKDNTKQKLRLQTNDTTTYDGADAMRQLVHWAEYGDRRLTGCIVRHRRFADPKDPTVQKSSLGIVQIFEPFQTMPVQIFEPGEKNT